MTGAPRPFRFGLIGAGVAAEIHVTAMRTVPGVEVHAIADAVPERARALATRYGIPDVYESGEALASRAPVDAVAVLTPHHLHLPYVVAAANAGRHVLVEKAIAHTVTAADELIEVCRVRGVTLAGIFQNRFTPAARLLREAVASGVLGRVFLASVTVKEHRAPGYFLDSPWRGRKGEAGGGVLMIQAIHMLDLLVWVLGMPRRVVAQSRTAVHDVQVEDVAVGLLEFESGVVAALQATTGAMPEQPPSIDIHGDRGTATVSGSWGHLALRLRIGAEPGEDVAQESPAGRPSVEPYAAQIADFVTAIRKGRPPLVDGAEARKALVVVEALYRSGHDRQVGHGRDPGRRSTVTSADERRAAIFDMTALVDSELDHHAAWHRICLERGPSSRGAGGGAHARTAGARVASHLARSAARPGRDRAPDPKEGGVLSGGVGWEGARSARSCCIRSKPDNARGALRPGHVGLALPSGPSSGSTPAG